MKVTEIFTSIDGEGVRSGYPVTFVRLYGCNLRCGYCDTIYSHTTEADKAKEMSVNEIIGEVLDRGVRRVTITGGEPLIHEGVLQLIDKLTRQWSCWVNVETNGTMPVPYDMRGNPRLIYTMDYKCPSSGMNHMMRMDVLETLSGNDVLKFVVGSREDLETMEKVLDEMHCAPEAIFVSPVFSKIEPKEIVEYILEHKLHNCRVQLQIHKIIWPPEERGV